MLAKLVLWHQYFHFYSVIIHELIAAISGPNNISKPLVRPSFHGAKMRRVHVYAVRVLIVYKNSCNFVKTLCQFSMKSIANIFKTVSAFLL